VGHTHWKPPPNPNRTYEFGQERIVQSGWQHHRIGGWWRNGAALGVGTRTADPGLIFYLFHYSWRFCCNT